MPPAHPPESCRRAIELARERAKPIAQIAADIGISESCLRTWLRQADVDEGRREGLTTEERVQLVRLRRENRVLRMEKGDPGKSRGLLRRRDQLPLEVTYDLVETEKANYPTTVLCRSLGISTSSFYDWRYRTENPSPRARRDAALTERIRAIHTQSRGTYGAPRVHTELRLGEGIGVGRRRVARLMRAAGILGVYRRRRGGCTRRDPGAELAQDLVMRQF